MKRTYTMPKSKRGAVRQYNAIMRAAHHALRGGLQYGMDWPTFRCKFPDEAAHVTAVKAAYPTLPD
jgi:hypothetical protein